MLEVVRTEQTADEHLNAFQSKPSCTSRGSPSKEDVLHRHLSALGQKRSPVSRAISIMEYLTAERLC